MAFSGAFIVVYFVLGLVALAFAGIVASSIGCFFRPRIFGFIGVAAALLCLGFWILFWAVVTVRLSSAAGKWGLDIGQHAQTSMSAVTLFGAAEAARGPAGEPPATFDFSQVPAQLRTDPWGRSYRYVLVPGSARGYSFVSDGPDGVPGTPDDLDLLAIHPTDGTFGLPPIRRATAGSAGPP